MFKKRRKRELFDPNLDSLMDILTCSIGVMLFVVIFTVIAARSARVKMFSPMLKEPPQNSKRNIFICENGKIKLLDIDASIQKLLKGESKIDFYSVPSVVKKANKKDITDGYFNYRLDYDELSLGTYKRRSINVIIEPVEGVSGESVEDLKEPSSKFSTFLEQLDKEKTWICFLVDKESLELFREARETALKHNLATGWDPLNITFPHKECILGCGGSTGRPGIAEKIQQF